MFGWWKVVEKEGPRRPRSIHSARWTERRTSCIQRKDVELARPIAKIGSVRHDNCYDGSSVGPQRIISVTVRRWGILVTRKSQYGTMAAAVALEAAVGSQHKQLLL
jgi:hypothetical protein